MSVFDFKVLDAQLREVDLSKYKGKVLLIVNTASKCGFTPQFAGLEELHHKYAAKGLVVLGFPCNQFMFQDPGSNDQIQEFCKLNYGVTFPVLNKIDVNGKNADPLFVYLREKTPGPRGGTNIKWNFTKFLVSKDGETVTRFDSAVEPLKLTEAIEALL